MEESFDLNLFKLDYLNWGCRSRCGRSKAPYIRLSTKEMNKAANYLKKNFQKNKYLRNMFLIEGSLVIYEPRTMEIQAISLISEKKEKLERLAEKINLPFKKEKIFRGRAYK